MTTTTRHTLLRTGLIAFVLVDLLLLASFIFDEWFGASPGESFGLAMELALPAAMLVSPLVDISIDDLESGADIPATEVETTWTE